MNETEARRLIAIAHNLQNSDWLGQMIAWNHLERVRQWLRAADPNIRTQFRAIMPPGYWTY